MTWAASGGASQHWTRKRKAIVEAATTTFLQKGYLGTSMDEIAALAGVTKQTVYKHFADKERLFSDVVTSTVNEASDPVHTEVLELRDTGDLAADLRDLARRQVALVMQQRLMQLRRLVIAESSRFPELGRTFYEQDPVARSPRWPRRSSALPHAACSPEPCGRAVQLAGDVGTAQPGDAARP
jgi:AcrR family transcriptional regulator